MPQRSMKSAAQQVCDRELSSGKSGTNSRQAKDRAVAERQDGMGDNVAQGSRQGWWYVFADANGGSQTPASHACRIVVLAVA